MKVLTGVICLIASLFPSLGQPDEPIAPIPNNDCHYACAVAAVAPVCGTDGNTYSSKCYVECVSRNQVANAQAAVSVRSEGRCPEKPCVCGTIFSPVCGTNGRTYPNVCQLQCDSRRQQQYDFPPIFVKSLGSCPNEGCICPAVVQPVCGTNGVTYENQCKLVCDSKRQQQLGRPPIYVARYGPCPPSTCNCPQYIAPVCGTDGKSYRNICFLECGSRISQNNGGKPIWIRSYGVCPNENCICPANVAPVCGSDGNTYNNVCALQCQNGRRFALGQPPLWILYNGPCKSCICSDIYLPVCGSDGRTYSNLCLLNCENQRRGHLHLPPLTYTNGECGCFCAQIYQPVCATDFRTYNNLCELGCENRRRLHSGLPPLHVVNQGVCSCNCSDFNLPVCGSDRRTYRNVCWFNCNNFFLIRNGRPPITIVNTGVCH